MSNTARKLPPPMTVAEFLRTDQASFGPAWRYELVDGYPVAQAAPSDDHGAIIANLAALLKPSLKGTGCRAEAGSAAIPKRNSRTSARIPDVIVRCQGKPLVLIEVLSPSDEHSPTAKAARDSDLRDVDGVTEIVEFFQDEPACRLYRWRDEISGWQIEQIAGFGAVLPLRSLGLELPLAEVYDGVLAIPVDTP